MTASPAGPPLSDGAAAGPAPASPANVREAGERARAQRERILRAAKRCFVEHGFHAASVADIARTAEMSAGLIYRYFDSKDAIVRGIVDRQIEEARTLLDSIGSAEDLVAAILDHFERWSRPQDEEMNAALFLEMAAEATRDPRVAEVTRAADAEVRARLREALQRTVRATGRELDAAAAERRVLALQCVIEGVLVRAVRQPDLDRATLRACLEKALAGLIAP
ncbi:MAG TPA: TetR/AcrR family transcriptional regulator [Thermoanaerobaculia bacterium]|nr:TetR/AcrR family transcriptional regulator [Thermoanaerobaculia bacterium]